MKRVFSFMEISKIVPTDLFIFSDDEKKFIEKEFGKVDENAFSYLHISPDIIGISGPPELILGEMPTNSLINSVLHSFVKNGSWPESESELWGGRFSDYLRKHKLIFHFGKFNYENPKDDHHESSSEAAALNKYFLLSDFFITYFSVEAFEPATEDDFGFPGHESLPWSV